MNVDLHTHTYPASDCSRISYRDYIAWCVDNAVEAVALTNHGDISDNLRLGPALAAEGVLLIDGVEISTLFGDFVIFSPDLDYLETLRSRPGRAAAGERPGATPRWCGCTRAPAAGAAAPPTTRASRTWSPASSTPSRCSTARGSTSATSPIAEQIAGDLGVARTGGSDAHDPADAHDVLHGDARPRHLDGRRGARAPAAGARSRTGAGAPAPRKRFGLF